MKKIKSKHRRLPVSHPLTNILICGVGGQGILLASDILCHAAMQEGYDVKKSEVHGMAQRGGSVITHVRFGAVVHSPLIEEGTADYVLAFEKLEALRYAHYLGANGTFVVNAQELPPSSVLLGAADYPADAVSELRASGIVELINAAGIAKELGNMRTVNIILLGGLSKHLSIKDAAWEKAIRENLNAKYHDINLAAFYKGRIQ